MGTPGTVIVPFAAERTVPPATTSPVAASSTSHKYSISGRRVNAWTRRGVTFAVTALPVPHAGWLASATVHRLVRHISGSSTGGPSQSAHDADQYSVWW